MTTPAKLFEPRTPSSTTARALSVLGALVLGAGLLVGCAPSDPIEDLEERRSRYSAELASFSVVQTPIPEAAAEPLAEGEEADDAGAAAGETAEEGADEEAMTAEEPVEVEQDVILDILLRYDGHDALPGLTLDVTHAGPEGEEKGVHHAYIDTTAVHRGPPAQITHRLEDVPYEEGDGFHVEVRSPVPAAERGEYRELSEVGEGA